MTETSPIGTVGGPKVHSLFPTGKHAKGHVLVILGQPPFVIVGHPDTAALQLGQRPAGMQRLHGQTIPVASLGSLIPILQ